MDLAVPTRAERKPPRADDPGIVTDVDIPPCPSVLMALLEEARRPEPDFPTLSRFIASDMALGAAMLKTVNSPFYGLRSPAISIQQALQLLGVRKTVGLATGLLLRSAFSASAGEVTDHVWESSTRLAAALARLSRSVARIDRDEAYTFGMFRDCGMLVLARKYADYAALARSHGSPHDAELEQSEAARYLGHHAQVGFQMAKGWYLPEELCLAVRHHHNPAILGGDVPGIGRTVRALVATGLLVDRILCEAQSGQVGTGWEACGAAVMRCLDIDEIEIASLAPAVLDTLAGLETS